MSFWATKADCHSCTFSVCVCVPIVSWQGGHAISGCLEVCLCSALFAILTLLSFRAAVATAPSSIM